MGETVLEIQSGKIILDIDFVICSAVFTVLLVIFVANAKSRPVMHLGCNIAKYTVAAFSILLFVFVPMHHMVFFALTLIFLYFVAILSDNADGGTPSEVVLLWIIYQVSKILAIMIEISLS